MSIEALSELELASPAVVSQAARDFAVALAATAQFTALEAASERLRQDQAASTPCKPTRPNSNRCRRC
jgi:hypothetical protein